MQLQARRQSEQPWGKTKRRDAKQGSSASQTRGGAASTKIIRATLGFERSDSAGSVCISVDRTSRMEDDPPMMRSLSSPWASRFGMRFRSSISQRSKTGESGSQPFIFFFSLSVVLFRSAFRPRKEAQGEACTMTSSGPYKSWIVWGPISRFVHLEIISVSRKERRQRTGVG